jgi:CheY-like chemotaxis protein
MEASNNTVLLVDDNPANLKLLYTTLEEEGYELLVLTSGEAALESVKHRLPDIILLDVMMPGIDGFETCRRLKAAAPTRDIPVIFMTVLSDTVDEVKGLELGAVDYITKPIQVERVLARVKTHLTIRVLQKELQEKNAQLEEALANVKTLKGLLPMCANCKKIRDDEGYWHQVEIYVTYHTDTHFTHGLCPDCLGTLYPEYYRTGNNKEGRQND